MHHHAVPQRPRAPNVSAPAIWTIRGCNERLERTEGRQSRDRGQRNQGEQRETGGDSGHMEGRWRAERESRESEGGPPVVEVRLAALEF